jgi:phage terminase large subunit-like protein
MVQFGQHAKNYNEPTKKLLEIVREEKMAHGGHAILKWNASNLEVKEDKNSNLVPVKPQTKRSVQNRRRIDGVVATIMALGRALVTQTCDYPMAV